MTGARIVVAVAIMIGSVSTSFAAVGERPQTRVVVVLLEGADGHVVSDLLQRGSLPNLRKLLTHGDFALMLPPVPPAPEAAWIALATGMDGGSAGVVGPWWRDSAHGAAIPAIGGLVEGPAETRRVHRSMLIGAGVLTALTLAVLVRRPRPWRLLAFCVGVATAGFAAVAAFTPPGRFMTAARPPAPEPFWVVAGTAGVPSAAVHLPGRWPPRAVPGVRELARWEGSGSGCAPDLSVHGGRRGVDLAWSPPFLAPGSSPLRRSGMDMAPSGPASSGSISWPSLPEEWRLVRFRGSGGSRSAAWVRLRPGPTADEPPATVVRVVPHPRGLPDHLALSTPREWGEEVADRIGPAVAAWCMPRSMLDEFAAGGSEADLLSELEEGARWSQRVLAEVLTGKERLVVAAIPLPGTVSTVWGGAWDPRHPLVETVQAARLRAGIEAAYATADEIIGALREQLTGDDVLLVGSPHGVTGRERLFGLDAWLEENGFLGRVPMAAEAVRSPLAGVDWGSTTAYTLGGASIWLNLRPRDPRGTIASGLEAERVRRILGAALEAWVDPGTGRRPVARVWLQEEIFRRASAGAPDLVVTAGSGYGLTGEGDEVVSPARDPFGAGSGWALPERVPGWIVSSRPLRRRHLDVVDVAPTVLKLLDVSAPGEMIGQPFL